MVQPVSTTAAIATPSRTPAPSLPSCCNSPDSPDDSRESPASPSAPRPMKDCRVSARRSSTTQTELRRANQACSPSPAAPSGSLLAANVAADVALLQLHCRPGTPPPVPRSSEFEPACAGNAYRVGIMLKPLPDRCSIPSGARCRDRKLDQESTTSGGQAVLHASGPLRQRCFFASHHNCRRTVSEQSARHHIRQRKIVFLPGQRAQLNRKQNRVRCLRKALT